MMVCSSCGGEIYGQGSSFGLYVTHRDTSDCVYFWRIKVAAEKLTTVHAESTLAQSRNHSPQSFGVYGIAP